MYTGRRFIDYLQRAKKDVEIKKDYVKEPKEQDVEYVTHDEERQKEYEDGIEAFKAAIALLNSSKEDDFVLHDDLIVIPSSFDII